MGFTTTNATLASIRGQYATRCYLPCSATAKRLRRLSRHLRGKADPFTQRTTLPTISWSQLPGLRRPRVWIGGKRNGDVRLSEVAILSALAGSCPPDSTLFEIGTFDGRTTFHLAVDSASTCRVHTLDLPSGQATQFDVDRRERHLIEKPSSGTWIERLRADFPQQTAKIQQHFGDSATFDFSPYHGTCGLVFVDGSHAYDYVKHDTASARQLVQKGGFVLWHDYGVWSGVTRALEELEATTPIGLKHIHGTSLVCWQKP